MLRFSRAKIAATLAIILVGLALAVPSFFSPEQRKGFLASLPPWFPHWIVPTRAIVLGLDLQGGSQLLLEVDQNDLIASQAKSLRDDVRRVLQQESVRADGGIQLLQRGVQVKVTDDAARAKIWGDLDESLAKEVAYIPLDNPAFPRLHGSKVTNYVESASTNGYPDLGQLGAA